MQDLVTLEARRTQSLTNEGHRANEAISILMFWSQRSQEMRAAWQTTTSHLTMGAQLLAMLAMLLLNHKNKAGVKWFAEQLDSDHILKLNLPSLYSQALLKKSS